MLDEIRKDRLWKRNLKGLYDTLESPCDSLVSGSTRLNVYRRGSYSMLGCKYALQLVRQPGWVLHDISGAKLLAAGAAEALFRIIWPGPFGNLRAFHL